MTVQEFYSDLKSSRIKKVIMDTDTFNEIDDQYAVAYALCHPDRIQVLSYNAAPYFNDNSTGPADGMEKSYKEIKKVLNLMKASVPVYRGSDRFISEDPAHRPVDSPAARNIIHTVLSSPDPIYILAIGAITNVVSAIMLEPAIINNMAVIWLGGHQLNHEDVREFNLMQDYYAGQYLINCKVPLLLAPAFYVTAELVIHYPDVQQLKGHNPICDYLFQITDQIYRLQGKEENWYRVIWDIAAVAPLALPDSVELQEIPAPLFTDSYQYSFDENRHPILYMNKLHRDLIIQDCWEKLCKRV